MTRVCLFSEDHALQSLLSSALGKEFEVFLIANEDQIGPTLSARECDVMMLDLNPHHVLVQERINCARGLQIGRAHV